MNTYFLIMVIDSKILMFMFNLCLICIFINVLFLSMIIFLLIFMFLSMFIFYSILNSYFQFIFSSIFIYFNNYDSISKLIFLI